MHKQAKDSLEPDSSLLVKQAMWCGCVFSLAALMTALNCLPPVGIYFRVRAQVVASPERIEALKQNLYSDRSSPGTIEDAGIFLCSLAVLDQASKPTTASASRNEHVKLIEVYSRWTERASTASFRTWLEKISRVREGKLAWQLQAAEHYLAHHLHTSAANPVEESDLANSAVEIDSETDLPKLAAKSPMRLVGIIRPQDTSASLTSKHMAKASEVAGATTSETDRTRQQLEAELAAAQTAAAGMLAISGAPYIRAEAGSMPLWLASGVLVFALASGSCAGWLQHRLQSGGAFEPEAVASLLAVNGLAVVDRLNLSPAVSESRDWMEETGRRATKLSRRLACGLTILSECVLLSWCCVIALRFFLDPLWRNVFVDSPLAGIGRLIVGLP